ncbi:MAG: 3-isopropylmalate dehydratase small subunit [Rhodospirillales bacterium]
MQPFTTLTGIAAPLPMINVDTDMIIPKQFLKTIKRSGLGVSLFFEMRYDDGGAERADFILNRAPWRDARILVAGQNFGCGSSREHAPWALLDFGIRAVIAPSFADIFYNNCFKNGILLVTLPQAEVDRVMAAAGAGEAVTVDLPAQEVRLAGGESIHFDLDPFLKHCLVDGLDDIALTLTKSDRIAAFEAQQKETAPWLYR